MKQTFSFTAMLKRIALFLHVSRRRWLIALPAFSLIVTLFPCSVYRILFPFIMTLLGILTVMAVNMSFS